MNDTPETAPEDNRVSAPSRSGLSAFRIILVPSLLVFVCIYLLSGITIVKPEQEALVKRFGKLKAPPLLPGTHYCLPYPVDKVTYLKPKEVKSIMVGRPSMPEDEGEIEEYYIDSGLGEEFLTGDENIIYVTMNVQYKVNDPAAYLFSGVFPEESVRLASESALTDVVARTHVDDLMTSGKQLVLADVRKQAQAQLDRLGVGVVIISATFANVSPPGDVVDAFKDVASALEDRDRFINEAVGEYNAAIPRARGEAERQKQEALGLKGSRVNRARGDADRFLATLQEYRMTGAGDLSQLRLYVETMEEVMPRMKKYIVDTAADETTPLSATP